MNIQKKQPQNQTYILRCWRENAGSSAWRIALEPLNNNEDKRYGFTDLQALYSFLAKQLDTSVPLQDESKL